MYKDLRIKTAFTLAEGATHVGIFNNTRRVGFTLAEVLITLGIIGVVSAMTIPTLISNYQEKVLINKAKQAHAIVHNSIKLYMVQNDCYDRITCLFDTRKTSQQVITEFAKVLKGTKICPNLADSQQTKQCKSYDIKANTPIKQNGAYVAGDALSGRNRIVMPSGMTFHISQLDSCDHIYTYELRDEFGFVTGETRQEASTTCARLYVDINGVDKPNQHGYDIFRYDIKKDGKIDSFGGHINSVLKENKFKYTDYNIGDTVPGYEG